ncbi:MAG: hypothetical protein Q9182_005573 [Xanthomendoza sp. 2 TL-2023]
MSEVDGLTLHSIPLVRAMTGSSERVKVLLCIDGVEEGRKYDFEPSQTPTRPRSGNVNTSDGSPTPLVLGDAGETLDLGHLDDCLEDTIFEKGITGNRAKVPPNKKWEDKVGIEVNARTALKSPTRAADGKRPKESLSSIECWPADKKTQIYRLSLEWGRQSGDGQQCALDAFMEPQEANIEAQDNVIWQHSELENIELDRLIGLIAQLKAAGLEEIVVGLSKRLLNRVRLVTERDFVNGNFLTPAVMRYDLHNALPYCMFVSFPYFLVAEGHNQSKFDKEGENHPIRTLLQSRYRLNETVDRDKSQCIRMISGSALRSCIQAPSSETKHLTRQLNNGLIYVPQMWTLIMDLGHILTRSESQPVLDLRIEYRQMPEVAVKGSDEGPSGEDQQRSQDDNETGTYASTAKSKTSAGSKELRNGPVVKAFLAWRVMDAYGVVDVSVGDVQVQRLLEDIYASSLECIAADPASDPVSQTPGHGSGANAERGARVEPRIQGRKLSDVRTLCSPVFLTAPDMAVRKEILAECEQLLEYFVPRNHHEGSSAVQSFWGAVYALLDQKCSFFEQFLSMLRFVDNGASRIHLGVHFEQHIASVGIEPQRFEDAISDDAILEGSMVKALRAIFRMILQAVHEVSRKNVFRSNELPKMMEYYGIEACQLLQPARNQLIAEATGTTPERSMGSIVTPEAVLIKTMDRLARGVFGTGTVEVIDIYEEYLEQLALRVEKHSSRRLLQKLNAFEEEADVISEVLLQQINVLRKLRHCLDPVAFTQPTIIRQMRLEFEGHEIGKILDYIQEQRRYCKELRERAKVLAVQNVQLVETLADDNSRAIFVFTLITVLFLPLSFVAGFFGMNLLADSTKGVGQFWSIAVPLTVGVLVLCAIFVAWGVLLWFAASGFAGNIKDMLLGRKKAGKGER